MNCLAHRHIPARPEPERHRACAVFKKESIREKAVTSMMPSTSLTTTEVRPRISPPMYRYSWHGFGRLCAVIHDSRYSSIAFRTG